MSDSDLESDLESEFEYADCEIIYCKECNEDIRYYCCGICFHCGYPNNDDISFFDCTYYQDMRYNEQQSG